MQPSTPTVGPDPYLRPLAPDAAPPDAMDGELEAALDESTMSSAVVNIAQHKPHTVVRRFAVIGSFVFVLGLAPVLVFAGFKLYSAFKTPAPGPTTLSASDYNKQLPGAQNISSTDALLTVNSKLKVTGPSDLNAITVSGNATLQGGAAINGQLSAEQLTVSGDTTLAGSLRVQNVLLANIIQGSLVGSISGNFEGSGNGSFTGTFNGSLTGKATGVFTGSFNGDGSTLTNLKATSCADCVQLQTGATIAQEGNIRLNGSLSASKIYVRSQTNSIDAFTVQTATGENLLSADTLNKNVVVGNLLPNKLATITPGTYTPGYAISNRIASLVTPGDTAAVSNGTWQVRGSDGLPRFAYLDNSTTNIVFVRCQNQTCSTRQTAIVGHDEDYGNNSPMLALDSNDVPYVAYQNYGAPSGPMLVRCSDADCSSYVTTPLGQDYGFNGYMALTVDGNNRAQLVYGTNLYDDSAESSTVWFVRCSDDSCSSNTTERLVSNDQNTDYAGFSIAATASATTVMFADMTNQTMTIKHCEAGNCSTKLISAPDVYWEDARSIAALTPAGLPRFAYTAGDSSAVYYVACQTADCSSLTSQTFTSSVSGATGYGYYVDSLIFRGDSPIIAFKRSGSTGWMNYVVECGDASCTSRQQYSTYGLRYNFISQQLILDNNDELAALEFSNDDATINYIQKLKDTQVLPVIVNTVVNLGPTVGTGTNRFGQIYSADINVQSVGTAAGLEINKLTGLVGVSDGAIASFKVNGTEVAAIDSAGRFILGANTQSIQASANLTLIAGSNPATNVLEAFNASGGKVFVVKSDGGVVAGSSASTCADCLPANELSKIKLNNDSAVQKVSRYGNYMYVSFDANISYDNLQKPNSAAVLIYDVSDPAAPKFVNRIALGYGSVGKMVFNGGYGYLPIVAPVNALMTFNMSVPGSPRLVNTLTPSPDRDLYDLLIDGAYMYGVGNGGLHIWSLANPAAPVQIAHRQLAASYPGYALAKSGSTVFVRGTNTLTSITVANPTAPAILQTLVMDYVTLGVDIAVRDGYLLSNCFSDCQSGTSLRVVNIANPSQMSIVSGVGDGLQPTPYSASMVIEGNRLYRGSVNGVALYDVTNFAQPVLLKTQTYTNSIKTLLHNGDYLYLFDQYNTTMTVAGFGAISDFQKIKTSALDVNGAAVISGPLQVSGGLLVNQDNISIAGIRVPTILGGSNLDYTGVLNPPSHSVVYRVTAINAADQESAASAPYTVLINPISTFSTPTAAVAGSGSLTGTYQYKYTLVLASGESLGSPNSPPVTVAGKSVAVGTGYNFYGPQVVAVKVYRCTMPACSSYNLVGSIMNPTVYGQEFIDNNTTPGAAIPSVSTAYSASNQPYIYIAQLDESVKKFKIFRSFDGGATYSYFIIPAQSSGGLYFYFDEGNQTVVSGTPNAESTVGRLGIGVTTPRASLDVAGTVLFRNENNLTNAFLIQTALGATVLSADTTTSRIGVGTAAPQASLQVSADGSGGSLLRVTDTTATASDVLDIADTGIVTFRNQTDSNSAFRIQDAGGTNFVVASSTGRSLTVTNLVVSSSLQVTGHIVTGNSTGTTTAAAGAAAGTSGTCTVAGNDTSGTLTVVTGATGLTTGILCTTTFGSVYTSAPRTVVSPFGSTAAMLQYNIGATSTSSFRLDTATTPTASTTYRYFYIVVQ